MDSLVIQFNFLKTRIRRHASALVASGLYGEPTDATLASQVIARFIYVFHFIMKYIFFTIQT